MLNFKSEPKTFFINHHFLFWFDGSPTTQSQFDWERWCKRPNLHTVHVDIVWEGIERSGGTKSVAKTSWYCAMLRWCFVALKSKSDLVCIISCRFKSWGTGNGMVTKLFHKGFGSGAILLLNLWDGNAGSKETVGTRPQKVAQWLDHHAKAPHQREGQGLIVSWRSASFAPWQRSWEIGIGVGIRLKVTSHKSQENMVPKHWIWPCLHWSLLILK